MANNYVNPQKFNDLLLYYQKNQDKKTWNEIGKAFLLIANKQLSRINFINYSEDRKKEMESLACLYMIRYYKNFDPNKGTSAFAYFTQIAYFAYLQVIIANKKRDKMFTSLDFITSKESVNTSESYNCEEE